MRFLRRSLVGVFLLAMTVGFLAWAGFVVSGAVQARMDQEPRRGAQREQILAVNVVQIAPVTITPELTVFGELRSQRILELRASVGGTVIEVADGFVEGGAVQQGQVLLRIDPVDAQGSVARVEADHLDAEAEKRDAQRGLGLARDELTAAEEQARLRDLALTRQQDLQSRGVGTSAAVETAELAASSAQQAVFSRRQAVAQAEARMDLADTRLARVAISLAEARRQLDDTELVATFDGTLSDVSVIQGGRITANERVAQLVDPDRLEVSFRVSTAQYARLIAGGALLGTPVQVRLDVQGIDITAEGQITRESAAVGEGQTGRLLFATLQVASGFRPGDFVTVVAQEPALNRVTRVPATAVGADETVLVVGEEDRLRLADVELLRRQGDDVIIRARGLADAQIVAERSPLLGAGIKVRPILPGGAEPGDAEPEPPQTVTLDAERRARLVSFVQDSRMPDAAKTRILGQLEQDEVPAAMIERLESRMGS